MSTPWPRRSSRTVLAASVARPCGRQRVAGGCSGSGSGRPPAAWRSCLVHRGNRILAGVPRARPPLVDRTGARRLRRADRLQEVPGTGQRASASAQRTSRTPALRQGRRRAVEQGSQRDRAAGAVLRPTVDELRGVRRDRLQRVTNQPTRPAGATCGYSRSARGHRGRAQLATVKMPCRAGRARSRRVRARAGPAASCSGRQGPCAALVGPA